MNFDDITSILKSVEIKRHIVNKTFNETLSYYTADNVYSPINVPELRTSTRDGYGIFFNDRAFFREYTIIDKAYAGKAISINEENIKNIKNKLPENNAIYIATGAPVPDYVDTIVMVEDVDFFEGTENMFRLKKPCQVKNNDYIREPGSDIKTGDLLLAKNTLINETAVALFAMTNVSSVPVWEKPIIGILSSGDEVIEPGKIDKKPHEVYDANRYMLKSFLQTMNYGIGSSNIIDYGILCDDYAATKTAIQNILNTVDILISTGGISMGERDYIKPVLKEIGQVLVEKTTMKPGKPLIFTKYESITNLSITNEKYVFSLPGNPVSAGVTFKLFVQPFIGFYASNIFKQPLKMTGKMRENITADQSRLEFIRGKAFYNKKYDKVFVDLTTDNHMSSNLASMVDANCLIAVQPKTDITIGDKVDIYLINELKEDDSTCLNIGILTASDRAYNGIYGDKSGLEIQRILQDTIDDKKTKYQIFYKLVDDDKEKIKETLLTLMDGLCCTLVFTTGGTGPDFRDWTDVATEEVCHNILPGFGEIMRTRNFDMVPTSILSAQTAGIRYIYENKGSLIVNLPGKPEAIDDCLKIILKSVPTCLNIIHSADLFLKPNASLSQ